MRPRRSARPCIAGSRGRFVAALMAACVLFTAIGCTDSSPFPLAKIHGTVTYEDGSLIPADEIILQFVPLAKPLNAKTHPRKGVCYVNAADGAFDTVTTYKYGDGVVEGKHKVLVVTRGKAANVIPAEYFGSQTTPIEIDTANSPLELRVAKPAPGRPSS